MAHDTEHGRAGVIDRFVRTAADGLEPDAAAAVRELAAPRRNADDEVRRAAELLTRARDWAAQAIAITDAVPSILEAGAVASGEDARRLVKALDAAEPPRGPERRVIRSACEAARAGTALGPDPADGIGAVRTPGVPVQVSEGTPPQEAALLAIGDRVGRVLAAWADAGLGDPVAETRSTVRAATGIDA